MENYTPAAYNLRRRMSLFIVVTTTLYILIKICDPRRLVRLHIALFGASGTHPFPFWVPVRKELKLHDESVHVAFELKIVVEGVTNERVW